MAYPRHLTVPPDAPGTYHCVSRCVRRAFLCGTDPVTGHSFEHRKAWLEERVLALAKVFAVAVHAYAIMSNHLHVVLETDPGAPATWSDEEVARRWLMLTASSTKLSEPLVSRVAALAAKPERLVVLRERLGSLSWFMRYLKEPVARHANAEDGCTGRFWEGRFRTQALLDEPAVLTCMVYVDLNPVRSGVVDTPESGPHTSVRRRATTRKALSHPLAPLAGSIRATLPELSTAEYLTLVDWSGRELHGDRKAAIPAGAPPVLERLRLRPRQWLLQVPATESRYWRAIGHAEALLARARESGLQWLRGIGTARALQRLPEAS